jgi:hypothetical protein
VTGAAAPRLRIVFVPNPDEDYPWPWTAFLQELDGGVWGPAAEEEGAAVSADGDDPDDALAKLREQYPRAEQVKVKVPRWRRKERRDG